MTQQERIDIGLKLLKLQMKYDAFYADDDPENVGPFENEDLLSFIFDLLEVPKDEHQDDDDEDDEGFCRDYLFDLYHFFCTDHHDPQRFVLAVVNRLENMPEEYSFDDLERIFYPALHAQKQIAKAVKPSLN